MNALAVVDAEIAPFSLSAEIRDVLETTTDPDPRSIAKVVAAAVPEELLRTIVAVTVVSTVRAMMAMRRAPQPADDEDVLAALPQPSRYSRVPDRHREILRNTVCVGKEWKFFGDCELPDVKILVSEREENAAKNLAIAARYAETAKKMRQHKATTVADLPKDVLVKLWEA